MYLGIFNESYLFYTVKEQCKGFWMKGFKVEGKKCGKLRKIYFKIGKHVSFHMTSTFMETEDYKNTC